MLELVELVETSKRNFPTDVRSRALSKAIPLVKYRLFQRLTLKGCVLCDRNLAP